jgi:hypothetical protein
MSIASPRLSLPFAGRLARIAVVRDDRELVRADFDGSRLGTVELSDGCSVDVVVDVDPSPRGDVSFSAFGGDESAIRWVSAHEDELRDAWAAREQGEG